MLFAAKIRRFQLKPADLINIFWSCEIRRFILPEVWRDFVGLELEDSMSPHVGRNRIHRPACLADDLQDLSNSAEPHNWHASATPCGTSPSQSGIPQQRPAESPQLCRGCFRLPFRIDRSACLSRTQPTLRRRL